MDENDVMCGHCNMVDDEEYMNTEGTEPLCNECFGILLAEGDIDDKGNYLWKPKMAKTAEDEFFETSLDMIFQYYGLEDISDQFRSSIKKDILEAHDDVRKAHGKQEREAALREMEKMQHIAIYAPLSFCEAKGCGYGNRHGDKWMVSTGTPGEPWKYKVNYFNSFGELAEALLGESDDE